jgi:hypothetical protein
MTRFAHEIDDRPMILAPLNVAHFEPHDLGTPKTASEQKRDDGGITLPSECLRIETGQ